MIIDRVFLLLVRCQEQTAVNFVKSPLTVNSSAMDSVGAYGRLKKAFPGDWQREMAGARRGDDLEVPRENLLNLLKVTGNSVIAIGRVGAYFEGCAITKTLAVEGEAEVREGVLTYAGEKFFGLAMADLVLAEEQGDSLGQFEVFLDKLKGNLQEKDILLVVMDYEPEEVLWLAYGDGLQRGLDMDLGDTVADIGATISAILRVPYRGDGKNLWKKIKI